FSHTHTPPTQPSPLSLHDALPISTRGPVALLAVSPPRASCCMPPVSALSRGGIYAAAPTWQHSGMLAREGGLCPSCTHVLGLHRSEEHTSELQSLTNLVCRLLLDK